MLEIKITLPKYYSLHSIVSVKHKTQHFLSLSLFLMLQPLIQMAVLAGHVVAYTIGSILKHIIDCVQLYFTNGCTNIIL